MIFISFGNPGTYYFWSCGAIIHPLSLLIKYSTIPNPSITKTVTITLIFLGDGIYSNLHKYPLLSENS